MRFWRKFTTSIPMLGTYFTDFKKMKGKVAPSGILIMNLKIGAMPLSILSSKLTVLPTCTRIYYDLGKLL